MKENKAVGVMKPGQIFTIEPMINAGCLYILVCWHFSLLLYAIVMVTSKYLCKHMMNVDAVCNSYIILVHLVGFALFQVCVKHSRYCFDR